MIKNIKAAVKNIVKPQTQKVADQRVNTINDLAKHINSYADWKRAGAFLPPPHIIKQQVILEYKEKYNLENLIETGTFKGDMVDACKDYFSQIYSIELSEQLYTDAVKRFSGFDNISIIQGDSMDMLKTVLPKISGSPLFWLDGHYSAGITAKGKLSTPVKTELEDILNFAKKAKWQSFVILVDDARCFTGEDDYPTLFELHEFIKGLDKNLSVNVKNDIIRICEKG